MASSGRHSGKNFATAIERIGTGVWVRNAGEQFGEGTRPYSPLANEVTSMPLPDTEYYRARASEERMRARDSQREHVRLIHEELARQYEALVERAELRPTFLFAFGGGSRRDSRS